MFWEERAGDRNSVKKGGRQRKERPLSLANGTEIKIGGMKTMSTHTRQILKRSFSLLCAAAVLLTSTLSASAAALSADDCYVEGYDSSVALVEEGAVLLKNTDQLLPLTNNARVTLLGSMSYNYMQGSGGGNTSNTVNMKDAFTEAGLDVNEAAWSWLEEQCGGSPREKSSDPSGLNDWTSCQGVHEFSIDVYNSGKSVLCADGYTEYAIVTIGRSGGEGSSPNMDYDGDGSTLTGSTYLELNQDEKDLLEFCGANYDHTIVLINSGAAMELGFLDVEAYGVDACLWIGLPGASGMVGVGTILGGQVNPSGRLVDTWAYDVTTNPTYYNNDDNRYANADNQPFYQYEEGIYVGYRFFETADAMGYFDSDAFTSHTFKNGTASGYGQVVQFPFGYGLSYTTFSEEIVASDVKLEPHGSNSVTVRVTNTGEAAGKNVVQLYMEAPYQSDTDSFGIKGVGLEKSKVVLVGFGKTDILEAGQSQELTIAFDTDELASFDNFGQGCYVLEAGTYKFNVQKDAHQWGDAGSANAPSASVSAGLSAPVIYDDAGSVSGAVYAGARASDAVAAKNAMDDVTAGDGNMLDGYLSRADFAGGMEAIMGHASDEVPNEVLPDSIEKALTQHGTEQCEYTYETYRGGVKTTASKTMYAFGADSMPYAKTTPDGQDANAFPDPLWDQVYYVMEGETTESGLPVVVDAAPSSGSYHQLSVEDMTDVPIDTDEGFEIWEKLTNMTSLEEAIEVQGNCGWMVPAVPSVGKPKQVALDGPAQAGSHNGSTFFPCEVIIASTWNTKLAREMGVAYGHQDVLFGIGCAYAPAMNTHRSPFGGRNLEYYSEDGLLAGVIGGHVVSGIQSTGTSVFVKHMALNDNDTNRDGAVTWANEQAVREIYMRPYEISCKDYAANGIMASLNRIGISLFHFGMYDVILRQEWGWQGLLITDGNCGSGDVYNNPLVMMSVRGATLGYGNYINMASTEAAFGDSTQYVYTRYALHEIMRHCLYQYCGAKGTDESGNTISGPVGVVSTSSGIPTGAIVLAVIGACAVIAAAAAVVIVRKKKNNAHSES